MPATTMLMLDVVATDMDMDTNTGTDTDMDMDMNPLCPKVFPLRRAHLNGVTSTSSIPRTVMVGC